MAHVEIDMIPETIILVDFNNNYRRVPSKKYDATKMFFSFGNVHNISIAIYFYKIIKKIESITHAHLFTGRR